MFRRLKIQFQLKTLLGLVACSAVFCAAATWIIRADTLDSWHFPFLFMPSIPMMGVGFIGSFVVCLGSLVASGTLVARARHRPLTSLLFFGTVALVFVVDESASLRLLLVMSSSAIAFLAETLVRRLPTAQIVASALAIVLAGGYYFLLLFGFASAGV